MSELCVRNSVAGWLFILQRPVRLSRDGGRNVRHYACRPTRRTRCHATTCRRNMNRALYDFQLRGVYSVEWMSLCVGASPPRGVRAKLATQNLVVTGRLERTEIRLKLENSNYKKNFHRKTNGKIGTVWKIHIERLFNFGQVQIRRSWLYYRHGKLTRTKYTGCGQFVVKQSARTV